MLEPSKQDSTKTGLHYNLQLHMPFFRDGLLEIRRCKNTENDKIY